MGVNLAQQDLELVFCSPCQPYNLDTTIKWHPTKMSFRDYSVEPTTELGHIIDFQMFDIGILDAQFFNYNLPSKNLAINVCAANNYWLNRLINNPPAFLLIWGSSLPLSQLLVLLAEQLGIPYFVIERGFISNSLMIEPHAHGARSILNYSLAMSRPTKSGYNSERIESLKHKVQLALPANFISSPSQDSKKKILILGDYDVGAGRFNDSLPSLLESKFFKSTPEMIHYLDVFFRNDSRFEVFMRKHPSDNQDFTETSMKNANLLPLEVCLADADVIICSQTTVQFTALLLGKPILLLANSVLSGKEICYEPKTLEDFKDELEAAIKKDNLNERMERGYSYLDFLLDNFLIGLNPTIPTKFKLSDLSNLITFISNFRQQNDEDFSYSKITIQNRYNEYKKILDSAADLYTLVQIEKLSREIKELQNKNFSLEFEKTQLVSEKDLLIKDKCQIEKDLQNKLNQLMLDNTDLQETARKVKSYENEIKQLNQQLGALVASTTWRYSKPLRAIADQIKRKLNQ